MVRFQINGPVEFSASRGLAAGIHTDWVQIQRENGATASATRWAQTAVINGGQIIPISRVILSPVTYLFSGIKKGYSHVYN